MNSFAYIIRKSQRDEYGQVKIEQWPQIANRTLSLRLLALQLSHLIFTYFFHMVAKVVTSSSMFTYSSQSSSQRDMYDLLPTSFSTKHPQWCLSTLFGFMYLILNQCLYPEGYYVSGLACGEWLDEVGLYQLDRANTIIFSTTPHLVMLCWELKVSQSSCLFPYLIWLRALPDVCMHPSAKMNSSVRFLGGWQNISQKILWASIPSLFYPSGGFLCMWSRGGLLDLNERYGHLIFLL